MDKKDVLQMVQRQFNLKRQQAEAKAQVAWDFACQNESFYALEIEERNLIFDMGKNMFLGKAVDQMQKRIEQIKDKKTAILKSIGMTDDDLSPQYQCKNCNDTGIVEGKRCKCFQHEINRVLSQNSNIVDKSLSLDTFVAKTEKQRQIAETFSRFLAKAKDSKIRDIFVSGQTGTGKTHLITCLANDLLKQNFSVLFVSAFNLNNMFLQIHLAPVEQKETMWQNILSTEVLVIDDLGSENKYNNVTEEYLCNLLNERKCAEKYTFITSNLDFASLRDMYGDRIHSRISSNDVLRISISGADLRLGK